MKPFKLLFLAFAAPALGLGAAELSSPWNMATLAVGALFCFCFLFAEADDIAVRLCGTTWKREDFFRGWIITGRTGSGKTQSAINNITFQCFQNMPSFGAVCLDQKGLYYETLSAMAKHFGRTGDLTVLQTRPGNAPANWKPVHSVNLLGNDTVPALTYAKLFVDTAQSLTGKSENPFFPTKAQLSLQTGIEILRFLDYARTIPHLYNLLLNKKYGERVSLELFAYCSGDKPCADERIRMKARQLLSAFQDNYLKQPSEQLGGVQSTIETYLGFFLHQDLVDVFSNPEPTFSIEQLDKGKILCVAMPQKFQAERIYVNTMLKLSFYFHVLQRFDKSREERDALNPLILFADEGQEIVSAAESAFADHRSAGVIREARATIVFSTQAYTSIYGTLDRKYADVFKLNLSNQLIFTCADQASAEEASKLIGEREVVEKSWSYSGGKRSVSFSKKIKPFFQPFQLRKLPKFTCVCVHCEGKFRKRFLSPINPDGSLPSWFLSSYPIRSLFQLTGQILCKIFNS